jgi:hypothetical protein
MLRRVVALKYGPADRRNQALALHPDKCDATDADEAYFFPFFFFFIPAASGIQARLGGVRDLKRPPGARAARRSTILGNA